MITTKLAQINKWVFTFVLIGFSLVAIVASFLLSSGKAMADCGVQGGSSTSYAGALISAKWTDAQGNVHYSKNTAVRVRSGLGRYVVRTSSDNLTTQQWESDVHFNPINIANCGFNINAVVLGYGTTSPAVSDGSRYWSLDCRTNSNTPVPFTFSKGVGADTPVDLNNVSAPDGGDWSSLPNKYVTNGGNYTNALVYTPPAITTNTDYDIRNRLMNGVETNLSNPGSYTRMYNDTAPSRNADPNNDDDTAVVNYASANSVYYKPASSSCSGATGCVTVNNYKGWNFVSDAKANATFAYTKVSAPATITINNIAWNLYGFKECTNSTTCWTNGLNSVPAGNSYTIAASVPSNTKKNIYWAYQPSLPTCSPSSASQTVTAGASGTTTQVSATFNGVTNAETAYVGVYNMNNLAYQEADVAISRNGGTFYYNQTNGTTYRYIAFFVNDRATAQCYKDITVSIPSSVDLKVNGSDGPVTIARDAALTASWSGTNLSTGTNPCTATANPTTNTWTGAKPGSGSGVALDNTTPANTPVTRTYTISCTTSSGGTATDSVTVTVVPPPAVIIRANGTAGTVYANINDPLSLTWESSNVTSCSASVPSSNPAITSWSGAKATNNSTGENHNADTAVSNTIVYRITCNGIVGSSPSTGTSDVTVVVNASQYYPWFQTDGGDVRSVGTIVGQSLGLATNLNDNPGGRRYDSSNHASPTAEAEYVVVASGTGSNFCSFNFYNLGVKLSDVQNSCKTGGYSPASVDFGTVASSLNSAWVKNGSGVSPANAKCVPHNTAVVGANINTDLNLACTDINQRICNDGTPIGSPTCPVGSPNLQPATTNPSPSAGGGIQKKETGNSPSNIFNITPGGALTVNGRGTLWVRPASNVTEPSVLTITQNITYPATVNLTAPSQLPNFAIFVEGDVYISNAVTRVDATIIATGSIYTCGEGVSTTAAACSNNLVANGMWASGGTINFGRRAYNKNTPTPAEKIVLTVQSLAFPAPGLSRKDGDTNTGLEIDPNEYQPRIQ